MLRKILWLLPLLLSITSCATLFTKKEYNLKLYSKNQNASVMVNDSTYKLPAKVRVKRSKNDLKLTLITDSVTTNITIHPALSHQFVYGNLLFMHFAPAAYATDLTTIKRFSYGRKAWLNDTDTITVINPTQLTWVRNYIKKDYPTQKGQINLVASIPYANLFLIKPRNEPVKKSGGFFGLSVGGEYYYKDTKFIKVAASAAIDFEAPVPVSVDYFDAHEQVSAYNFTLTDNYKLKRFTLGYGLNYAIYKWQIINSGYKFPSQEPVPRQRYVHGYGLSLSAYHQINSKLFVGLLYNPTFYNSFPDSKYSYQHVLSLDVQFKLTLHK